MTYLSPLPINTKINRLTLLEETEPFIRTNGLKRRRVKCQCDCGKIFVVDYQKIKLGTTKSCGCYNRDKSYKHGFVETRLYNIYHHIKTRCYNSNDDNYKWYGKRGITVCEEWLKNPKSFFEWAITNDYKDDLTIDRINNDGNYEPSNCRWVTTKINNRNKPSTKLSMEIAQEIRTLYSMGNITQKQLANKFGVNKTHIDRIIHYKKWT